jgi:hypothetical protein
MNAFQAVKPQPACFTAQPEVTQSITLGNSTGADWLHMIYLERFMRVTGSMGPKNPCEPNNVFGKLADWSPT